MFYIQKYSILDGKLYGYWTHNLYINRCVQKILICVLLATYIRNISDEMKGTHNYIGIDSTNDVKGEIFKGENVWIGH